MPSKLLIVKDNRDHISTIVHELAKVWSIHAGKENLRVFGIHDYDEFDAAFKCNFVLFLLNNETLSFENQVPKWLRKLGHYGRPTNNNFKYLVVREFRPSSEQIHIADRTASFWTENETERKPNERNIDATHVINVDEISRVLKWWPCVIQHTFKTRNARCKVLVETDKNLIFEHDSELKLKVERTKEDIQDFLGKFNALATASDDSKSRQLFIIGDPSKFVDTYKHLREEKIDGKKILLILVGENKYHPELPIMSTGHMFLSNMVFDILQVMVDLGIVCESGTLKKTLTFSQVKDPIKAEVNNASLKLTWSLKEGQDDVLSNPGYISVQIKNRNTGKWEEYARREASVSTGEIIIDYRKYEEEFQVRFEDAKTGSFSTPFRIKYPIGHRCKLVTYRTLYFIILLFMLKCHLEAFLMMVIIFPLGIYFLYALGTKQNEDNCLLRSCWIVMFAMLLDFVLLIIVVIEQKHVHKETFIGLIVASVANLVFSYLSLMISSVADEHSLLGKTIFL